MSAEQQKRNKLAKLGNVLESTLLRVIAFELAALALLWVMR